MIIFFPCHYYDVVDSDSFPSPKPKERAYLLKEQRFLAHLRGHTVAVIDVDVDELLYTTIHLWHGKITDCTNEDIDVKSAFVVEIPFVEVVGHLLVGHSSAIGKTDCVRPCE